MLMYLASSCILNLSANTLIIPIIVIGEGFLAATFCHEIDHLDGVLFTDKAIEILTGPKEARRIIMSRK